jgi:cholesterol transport system auxiliary component
MRRAIVAALYCALLGGCALLSKGEVSQRRYFSPEPDAPAPVTPPAAPLALELRLGRVLATSSLDERMMVRTSRQEVGFQDDRLWTERPETYLRRALARVLFEERGLRSVVRGAGPTLDVELIGFEEVTGPGHVGRVTLALTLSDERVASLQQTVSIERPVVVQPGEDDAVAVARALGEALRASVSEVATRVLTQLSGSPLPAAAAR